MNEAILRLLGPVGATAGNATMDTFVLGHPVPIRTALIMASGFFLPSSSIKMLVGVGSL